MCAILVSAADTVVAKIPREDQRRALGERCRALANALGRTSATDAPGAPPLPGQDAASGEPPATAITALVERCRSLPNAPQVGALALHLALLARYPGSSEQSRVAELWSRDGADAALASIAAREEFADLTASRHLIRLRDVRGELLVDVSHTIAYERHSGVQRTVREMCRVWAEAGTPFRALFWNEASQRLYCLEPDELGPLLEWEKRVFGDGAAVNRTVVGRSDQRSAQPSRPSWTRRVKFSLRESVRATYVGLRAFLGAIAGESGLGAGLLDRLLRRKRRVRELEIDRSLRPASTSRAASEVPILLDCSLLVPELVVEAQRVELYECARRTLRFRLSIVLYDLIPVLHPEFCVPPLRAEFLQYLRFLRVADAVSCISESVAGNAREFLRLLERTTGCDVAAHPLPPPRPRGGAASTDPGTPLALCVGAIEPRKNGLGVLRAAARVAAEGIAFRLLFVGTPGWLHEEFLCEVREARTRGLDVTIRTHVDEATLWRAYREARFTIFCSFAEGFGLPVVESLVVGCPVIASDRGSIAEIARGGGCLLVDPARVDEIQAAIRTLLTDHMTLARLKSEAAGRTWSDWLGYAAVVAQHARRGVGH